MEVETVAVVVTVLAVVAEPSVEMEPVLRLAHPVARRAADTIKNAPRRASVHKDEFIAVEQEPARGGEAVSGGILGEEPGFVRSCETRKGSFHRGADANRFVCAWEFALKRRGEVARLAEHEFIVPQG